MKCIKNQKTGNIIRVEDKQAYQMVGNTWSYVSKSEWKSMTRVSKSEEQQVQAEKKEETLSKKAQRRAKFKTEQ
jgi:hypothetical protein